MRYPTPQDPATFGFERIQYTKDAGRATVVINRPEVLNALDFQTLREMSRAFEDAVVGRPVWRWSPHRRRRPRLLHRAPIWTSSEQFLHRPRDYWKWMGAFIEAHDRLRNIGKPTIARLNGMTVGGGNEFNMACDLAVAADDVIIRHVGTARGSVPAARGHAVAAADHRGPAGARDPLPVRGRSPRRRRWSGAGESGRAARAARRGGRRLVDRLIEKLPEVTRYTKQQLNFWRDLSWHLTVGHARDWLTLHADAPETHEGITAFHEKRPVDYAGIRERFAAGGLTRPRWGPYARPVPPAGRRRCPRRSGSAGGAANRCRARAPPRGGSMRTPTSWWSVTARSRSSH